MRCASPVFTHPMPVMRLASMVEFISGAALICSAPGASTSDAESTAVPTTHPRTFQHAQHCEVSVFSAVKSELEPQVEDRHDHAAQVHHTLDEVRHVGQSGGRFVATNLLHPKDVDTVFLAPE